MKLETEKHNHKLTNLLKVSIFATLMLTPFLYVGTKCAYVVCNKNAYESYSGLNQNTQSNISLNNVSDIDYSKNYYIGNSYLSQSASATSSAYLYFDVLEVISNTTTTTNETLLTLEKMYIYANGNTLYYNFYTPENVNTTLTSASNFLIKVNIRSYNGNTSAIDNLNFDLANSNSLYYIDYFIEQQLDNVFEYATYQLTQSDLFKWTENTAIYSGVNAMTSGLGFQNNIVPILITYWFLLTVIYVILDIVLACFTGLTHMITKKTN